MRRASDSTNGPRWSSSRDEIHDNMHRLAERGVPERKEAQLKERRCTIPVMQSGTPIIMELFGLISAMVGFPVVKTQSSGTALILARTFGLDSG